MSAQAATMKVYDTLIVHPDETIKSIFPQMTEYKVRSLEINEEALKPHLSAENLSILKSLGLGINFYEVYQNGSLVGVILGENKKYLKKILQVFVAIDTENRVHDIYVQKSTAPLNLKPFRSKEYRKQFRRISLGYDIDGAYYVPPASDTESEETSGFSEVKEIWAHHSVVAAIKELLVSYQALYKKDYKGLLSVRFL